MKWVLKYSKALICIQCVRPQLYTICVYFKSDLFGYLNINEIEAVMVMGMVCVCGGCAKKNSGWNRNWYGFCFDDVCHHLCMFVMDSWRSGGTVIDFGAFSFVYGVNNHPVTWFGNLNSNFSIRLCVHERFMSNRKEIPFKNRPQRKRLPILLVT